MKTLLIAVFLTTAALALPAAAQPWCDASGLNPTERAICNDPVLGRLDAELRELYDAVETEQVAREQRRWLSEERNTCGSDIFCIERAYDERIAELQALRGQRQERPAGNLRPWCDATQLNPTERAICSDPLLADMDAALEAVYGSLRASDADRSQITWLREERDACGTSIDCIASAYLRRIVELGGRLRQG